jgi:hypothetical protein
MKANPWLGAAKGDVQIDWKTLTDSRVAAIQYFNGGYIVWNGIHAVAYQTGTGKSSANRPEPTGVQVRLHDWGTLYGRQEYGDYQGASDRQDYYKFTVDNLNNLQAHLLRLGLRKPGGGDIPLSNGTLELLNSQMTPVGLANSWRPNSGSPAEANLPGGTYYVRVKPTEDNLKYYVVMNLDSARESLSAARHLGQLTGRQQFRDFVGASKGDGVDLYNFNVQQRSFLRVNLSDFDWNGDANVELVDRNGKVIPLQNRNGKYGDITVDPGSYYLRVTPANGSDTNYTLTVQMAEELGTFAGRHEYSNRYVGGAYTEGLYRLTLDSEGDLHLALKNLTGDANVELLRDNGSGILGSTLVIPDAGSDQRGTANELKRYDNLPAGNYMVRVKLAPGASGAKYDLVLNSDRVGNDWAGARDLGILKDIAESSDYQFAEFVGSDNADKADVYKFQVADTGLVHLALKKPASDAEANLLFAHMRLQDESGKDVTFLNPQKNSEWNYAAANLETGKTYYLTVTPDAGNMTNYNLVINPVSKETINGFTVSEDFYKVFAKYRESLGTPTSSVTNHSSGSNYQKFQNGLIVSSNHGTYPVWWGVSDAYLDKYGGLSGLLGAPKGMEYSWNGGTRQDFAGGYIWWNNGTAVGYKPDGSLLYPPPSSGGSGGSGGGTQSIVEALRIAIIGQESGYNYSAVNPDSGALGFAQVMPANIPSWSVEALGYSITPAQFLNSPYLQLKIIDYKLNQYYQNAIVASGGDLDIAVRRVASAWYSGHPEWYTSTTPQSYNGNQYPSIAEYTLSVLTKFHQVYKPGGSQTGGSSGGSSSGSNSGGSGNSGGGGNSGSVDNNSSGTINYLSIAMSDRDYRRGDDWNVGRNHTPDAWEIADSYWQYDVLLASLSAGSIYVGANPSVTFPFYTDFTQGIKSDQEVSIGPNSDLSNEARNNANREASKSLKKRFEDARDVIVTKINQVVDQQLAQNTLGNMDIFSSLLKSASDWGAHLGPITFDGGNLHVIIHGTQKEEIGLSEFSIDYNPATKTIQWRGKFRYTVFDDFAFSEEDGNTGGAVGLVLNPCYKLQKYGLAKPYSIKLIVEESIQSQNSSSYQ